MTLIGGVAAVNALFLAVGYALLGRSIGATFAQRASWAGVALLLGAAAVGTGVFFVTILGGRASLAFMVVVAAVIAAAGLLLRFELPRTTAQAGVTSGALFGIVAAVCALGLVGGFRSSPWLDDAWGIWLPKGLALWHHGLDERVFVPNGEYVAFGVPDYPLWWSVVTGLGVQAAGDVDVRVTCAQLGLLVVAFVAAVGRLLWGRVRPWLLAAGVALIALSPELWRHVQGGVTDLALAIYASLFALTLAGWVGTREPFALFLATASGIAAVQIKTEGLAEVLVVGAIVALAAWPRNALGGVVLATGLAAASAVPWLVWRAAHDVPDRTPLATALDPGELADRAERVAPTVEELATQVLDPASWLLTLPLLVVLAALGYRRDRRPAWLLPPAGVAAGFVFLVWAYWANADAIDFLLATSAYRTIDPLVLAAAVFIPLQAERLLR